MDSLDLIKQLPSVDLGAYDDSAHLAAGLAAPAPPATAVGGSGTVGSLSGPTQSGSTECADAIRGLSVATTTPEQPAGLLNAGARNPAVGAATAGVPGASGMGASGADAAAHTFCVGPGTYGSSSELMQLGALQVRLPPQQQQQRRQSSPELTRYGMQGATCWASSSSLAGTAAALQPLAQPGSATAAAAAGLGAAVGGGGGSSSCTDLPAAMAARQTGTTPGCSLGITRPGGTHLPGAPVGPVWSIGGEVMPVGAGSGQQQQMMLMAGDAAAADHSQMLATMCQPRDMVVLTRNAVPSSDQMLALLAAPLPGDFAPASSAYTHRYTEVALYTEKGPYSVSGHLLAQQLQQRGLPSRLAAALPAPGTVMDGRGSNSGLQLGAEAAVSSDVETMLLHCMGSVRRSADIGRMVVVLRLGGALPEGGGGPSGGAFNASSSSEAGFVIAASAGRKSLAEEAVLWVLQQLETVLQVQQ